MIPLSSIETRVQYTSSQYGFPHPSTGFFMSVSALAHLILPSCILKSRNPPPSPPPPKPLRLAAAAEALFYSAFAASSFVQLSRPSTFQTRTPLLASMEVEKATKRSKGATSGTRGGLAKGLRKAVSSSSS